MKILTIINVSASADLSQLRQRLDEELQESWKLFAESIIREAYATDDPARIAFVLEAADIAAAQAQLGRLPLVKLGYFTLQFIELRPFTNWARLFAAPA
jgi:hypothetical protein